MTKDDLIKKRDTLIAKLKKERIAWNDYSQGEGILAGHEHSLHESQDTKFKLLEQKIQRLSDLISQNDSLTSTTIEAIIDGKQTRLLVSELDDEAGNATLISPRSPIGKALLEMSDGEERLIKTPKGTTIVRKIKNVT